MTRDAPQSLLDIRVTTAANELLAAGRNPNVRAVRAQVGGSNSEVAAALAKWRAGLQEDVAHALERRGIPAEIVEFVRLGIEAARRLTPAPDADSQTGALGAMQQHVAALAAQVELLHSERAQLSERIGRLETDLRLSRQRADAGRRAHDALERVRGELGGVKAERAAAQSEVAALQAQRASMAAERSLLQRERTEIQETVGHLRAELSLARTVAAAAEQAQQAQAAARAELGRLSVELADAQRAIGKLRAQLAAARRPPPRSPRRPPAAVRSPAAQRGAAATAPRRTAKRPRPKAARKVAPLKTRRAAPSRPRKAAAKRPKPPATKIRRASRRRSA